MNEVVFLFYFLTSYSIVSFLMVALCHHLELTNFPHADLELTQDHSHYVLFNPDVNFRKLSKVIVVEVAQL